MRNVESLTDLDALVVACRDAGSAELLAEAVACYRAGAFRACIVTTWISVVFDFVHKLRELDIGNDLEARRLLTVFDEARRANDIDASLSFEKGVIGHCTTTFEFVSPQERVDLERLLEDRHRCAHPAMRGEDERFEPSPELARVHMRAAVETLLGQRPTQGKAALSVLQKEVTSATFPGDWVKAKDVLSRSPLAKAKPALVRNFVRATYARLLEDGVKSAEAVQLAAAFRAAAAMHVDVFAEVVAEPGFETKARLACTDGRPRVVLRCLRLVPEVRQRVVPVVQVLLREHLERAAGDELGRSIHLALELPEFRELAAGRVAALDREELSVVVALTPRAEYASRAVTLYLASPNYAVANFIAENLILPLAEFLDAPVAILIRDVANKPNSQVGGGMYFPAVKARLVERGVWPEDVAQAEAR